MAKRLTAMAVAALKKSGLHHVGDGLYLRITPAGGRTWVFRYMHQRAPHSMGLGNGTLADARGKALAARALLNDNQDPLAKARADRLAKAAELASTTTFKQAATEFIAGHKSGWKNAKHAAQWTATLETYAYPVFGSFSVADIDVPMVLKVLKPIWSTKNETARRIRGRIEMVLDWAKVHEMRSGENPARWRGGLQHALPARPQASLVRHHPALPYGEIAEFMAALRAKEGTTARCLEFTILTAARTSEAIGAKWSEIDFEAATWTIPASRIKARREHRVPLSPAALALLKVQGKVREGDFVFAGGRRGRGLSDRPMAALLTRMKRKDITVHGFRSSFRDWAAEHTSYPNHVVEMALAHAVADKVEAAYRRGDLLAKRADLMKDWATFVDRRRRHRRAAQTASVPVRSLGSRRRRVVRIDDDRRGSVASRESSPDLVGHA
jgi:integrase